VPVFVLRIVATFGFSSFSRIVITPARIAGSMPRTVDASM